MRFEIWRTSKGRATLLLGTTESWELANFYARIVSLTGSAMVIGDAVFSFQDPPVVTPKSPLASYDLGRRMAIFAGAPGVPSGWP